ncbi:MAG: pilin [Candidatus Paceibacterota bacterium]|jgi:hypothetical protein
MFRNQKTFALVFVFTLAIFFASASLALAVDPTSSGFQLVPCDNTPQSPCDYYAFIRGVTNLINFFIAFAAPVGAVALAWAGFKYLSAGGDSGEVEKAKGIFKKVTIGIIIVLAGWLLVQTITSTLLKPGFNTVLKQ